MLAEVDRLRARLLPAPVAPPPPRGPAGAAFVGRVVSTSNGLGAGKFVKVNPLVATGAESEGGSATETVDTGASELVYLLRGTAATDDDLVCYRVPHRWVAAKKAASTGGGFTAPYPGCTSCTTWPTSMTLTFSSACKTAEGTTFFDDTITVQARPSWATTITADQTGDGRAWIGDNLHTDTFGDHFLYYLDCSGGFIRLSRIYQTSVFGSPNKDANRMTWSLTATGNVCSPFSMTNANVYSGGSTSCNGTGGQLVHNP